MKKDQETTDKPKSKTEYTEVQDVLESLTSLEDLEENVSSMEKGGPNKAEISPPFEVSEGGWGWMCVIGGGIMTFVVGGILRSFTLIFEQMKFRFSSSASETALIYSIYATTNMFTSPLATALATRFGYRLVAFVGAMVQFTGVFLSAFSTNILYAYIFYGFMGGFGVSLTFQAIYLIIPQYFHKKRARATSLVFMMDGFGAMILAPLLQFIFSHYGYTGSIIIISGLMLHLAISASLFRSPNRRSIKTDFEVETPIVKNVENAKKVMHLYDLNKEKQTCDGMTDDAKENDENQTCQNGLSAKSISNLEMDDPCENKLTESENKGDCFCQIDKQSESEASDVAAKEPPCVEYQKSRGRFSVFAEKLFKYLDLRLVKIGVFRSFCLVMGCSSFCFSTNNIHIAGLARERNITVQEVSLLLSIMGGVNIVAKILSGFVFDMSSVRPHRVYIFCAVSWCIGLAIILAPFSFDVASFYTTYLCYMFATAVFTTQESVILSDLVSRDSFPSAVGLSRVCRGIGILLGPTLGGLLKDYMGDYRYTYHIFGTVLLLAQLHFIISYMCHKGLCKRRKTT